MKKLSAIVISALFAVSLLSACSGAFDFSAPKDGLTSRSSAIMRQADHSANNGGNYYGGYSSSSETPWWYSQQAASTVTGDTAYYPSASADVGYSVYYPPFSGDTTAIDPWQPGQSSDGFWGDDPFAPESYQVISGSDSHGNSEPASQENPASQSSGGSGSSQTGSFEINFTANGGEGDANFTLVGTTVKSTGGKTAKDGWLNGTVFSGSYPQLGKGPTAYGSKNIQFTTTGACNVYVYATRGSSDVTQGNLYLINTSSSIVATVNPTGTFACYTLACPGAGSYALATDQVSSINIFAIKVDGSSGGAPSQEGSFEINFTETDIDRSAYFDAPYEYSTVYKAFTATDGWLNGQTLKYAVSIDCSYSPESALMRSIGFYAEDACKIYVYAATNDYFGKIVVFDDTIENVYGLVDLYDLGNFACYSLEVPSSGYYRLLSLSGVVNVYAIRIEY